VNPKIICCLALVWSGALAALSAGAADADSLRVVVTPSRTVVRIKEVFPVTLRVENPTATNQTVRVMSCRWQDEWKTSNTNVSWIVGECTRNVARNVEFPPGGVYTNQLEMLVSGPISQKTVSFRMGFTPIDSRKTYWSDEVTLDVLPPTTNNDGRVQVSQHETAAQTPSWLNEVTLQFDEHDRLVSWEAEKTLDETNGRKSTGNGVDEYLTKQISNILTECQKIKPGMTRAELSKVFTTEGGLSTAKHRTSVHRRCPYIRVDVDFKPSDPKQNVLEERPADTIRNISNPYLAWGIID